MELSPKGDRKKNKGISYVKLKATIFGRNCSKWNFKAISYVKWNYPPGIEYIPKGIEKIWRDFLCKIEGEFNFVVNFFFGPIHFHRDIRGVMGYNYISIKKCTTIFLWVWNFKEAGELPKNFQNHHLGEFLKKWSPTRRSKRVFLRPNFRIDFFLKKN